MRVLSLIAWISYCLAQGAQSAQGTQWTGGLVNITVPIVRNKNYSLSSSTSPSASSSASSSASTSASSSASTTGSSSASSTSSVSVSTTPSITNMFIPPTAPYSSTPTITPLLSIPVPPSSELQAGTQGIIGGMVAVGVISLVAVIGQLAKSRRVRETLQLFKAPSKTPSVVIQNPTGSLQAYSSRV